MAEIIEVDPFRCRVWHLHERLEEYVSEETCEAELRSFEERGQLIPAIGRRLPGGLDHDIEIICGLRRLFVARHLNKPLTVELREMSDEHSILVMDMENRQRKEVTPYERGVCYARWLREGHFESQQELARALQISTSHVSRLLKLARLPDAIVNAFERIEDIREGWGDISKDLDDARKRSALLKAAREISAVHPRPPAQEVYTRLRRASVRGRRPRTTGHDQVVKGDDGTALFRVRHQVSAVALILPLQVGTTCLQNIQDAVADILHSSVARNNPVDPQAEHRERVSFNYQQSTAAL